MSAQINLYHPRFLKQRELLSLGNVAIAAAAMYVLLAAAGSWAWHDAATHRDAATAVEAQLGATKGQVEAETAAAALRKPNPQLVAELENAEAMLLRRSEIAGLLESGAVGSTGGFTDYLRGFAHQTSGDLWLTGLALGAGGNDMEIRGSMLNPTALPDYIRRLGAEKAFQGRNFAALTMNRADPAPAVPPVAQGAASPLPGSGAMAAATLVLRPIDFVLTPSLGETKEPRP